MYKCAGWTSYGGSPDYMNPCSPQPSAVSVPSNWGGYQQPSNGNSYCALLTYHSFSQNAREFVGGNLLSPLVVGTKYFVSFKVALSINTGLGSVCASNNIGAMFSTASYATTNYNYGLITNNPTIHINSMVIDTTDWTIVSGSFIADSAYQHIIIGNFYSDGLTDTLQFGTNSLGDAYYYLDEVCVSTDSLGCDIQTRIQTDSQYKGIIFFPNPFANKLILEIATNEHMRISFYNNLGQQILRQTIVNSVTINTEQLAKGIYFYELRDAKGIVKSGKVIKE